MKDKQIESLIKEENSRGHSVINLIASENYVSDDVLEALGSKLTNKYAEGYPGARYYGGNEVVDKIENLCGQRALKTFNISSADWAVNVQPLSGSPANLAVYTALVPPGGKIMGLNLSDGGHLTHGHKASASGKFWTQVVYGVDLETEVLDYKAIKKIAEQEKPALIVAGFTAYPRLVDWKQFRDIADSVVCPESGRRGAILMVDMSHIAGLVAGGVYPSPFPYADVVTTTTHKTLRGPRGAIIFSRLEYADKINKAVFPGLQGGPHVNQIAGMAVALGEVMTPAFKAYTKQIIKNAEALAEELKKLGHRLISGGTDSHLILLDTWRGGAGLSGGQASDKLEQAGIIVNKNTIPGEKRSPMDPSGIRLGVAAETTRGKTEIDMVKIAKQIDLVLRQ